MLSTLSVLLLADLANGSSACQVRPPNDTSSTTAQVVLLPYFETLRTRCQRYEERETASRRPYHLLALGGLVVGTVGGMTGLFLHKDTTQWRFAQATSLLTGLASGMIAIGHFDAQATEYQQCLAVTSRAQARIVAEYASFTTINPGDSAAVSVLRKTLENDVQNNCVRP
jgi:hypothetical protein